VIEILNALAFLLIGYIGLHLPRSFLLFYVLSGVVIARVCWFGCHHQARYPVYIVQAAIGLALFSISYSFGMLAWGFWIWPADSLDFINALVLPALLFVVGTQAAQLSHRWTTGLLLSYSIGGLIYGLSALANAREPWWNVSQVFPLEIQVVWPTFAELNVRSVEQTAYPALLLFAPALWLLAKPSTPRQRPLALILLMISLLGAHVVWSLNGRLGWLALVLALLPLVRPLWAALRSISSVLQRNMLLISAVAAASLAFVKQLFSYRGVNEPGGVWSQGLCDERFSMFGSMLMRLQHAPWGGRILRIPYTLCGDQGESAFLAYPDGSITVVHNVPLEVYFTVGLLPVVLLMIVLIPCIFLIVRGFWLAWPCCDWHLVLRWGWFCFLLCQWLFQPLLYSDGLLYYFTFFVIGVFLPGAVNRFRSDRSARLHNSSGAI
jgi:hypothetical protein